MSRGHFFGVAYHRRMLKDAARTGGYQRALDVLVKPGDVVVDVGSGTGVMSIFAARAGARRVFAIESTPVARLSRQIIADNGLSDVIEVIEDDAAAVTLPEPADVLVTECMGSFVYSDAMLGVLASCRGMLKPGGAVCPSAITTWLAPTFLQPLFDPFSWWERSHYGIDFGAARASAENDLYPVRCPAPEMLMAPAAQFGIIRPTLPPPAADTEVRWTFARPGPIDSIVGWFDAQLAPEVVLRTGPGQLTHWGQVAFPIPHLMAEPGGSLSFHLTIVRDERDMPRYSWSGRYVDSKGREQACFTRGEDRRF
ncbi:MAG: 50S ribosomal protein L11 methyltransferase [Myxococcota bacterium]